MRDLFAQGEAAGTEAVARARAPRAGVSRPIHISGYDRKVGDFYATPDWVTEALLRHVQFRGRVWEPCCGAGAITTVMQRRGYDVTSTDIADHGFGAPGDGLPVVPGCARWLSVHRHESALRRRQVAQTPGEVRLGDASLCGVVVEAVGEAVALKSDARLPAGPALFRRMAPRVQAWKSRCVGLFTGMAER